jgi:hypothetical protein
MADRYVNMGNDLPSARAVYDALIPMTAVRLYYVEEEAICTLAAMIPSQVNVVSGTMQLHQVLLTEGCGQLKVRNLSCFCGQSQDKICACYDLRTVKIVQDASSQSVGKKVKETVKTPKGKKRKTIQKGRSKENQLCSVGASKEECLICGGTESDDPEGEKWIQCNKCRLWAHELCVEVNDPDFFFCDFCL